MYIAFDSMAAPWWKVANLCFLFCLIAFEVTSGTSSISGYEPVSGSDKEFVEVRLTAGRVRGLRRRQDYDIGPAALTDTLDQYLGVPYATAPIGKLRFQAPRPPSPWGGVLNATTPGWVCPQKPYYSQTSTVKQSEDCLNLNIYSPLIKGVNAPYPVMVFIHGGSYEEGSGIRYDGSCLSTHGVVVVTINYRLGVLGYLSSGDSHMPGNYGLLDQIEALTWIRHNIHHFRGNPDRVTIFGSSAGATSVGLLLVTPKSKGLVNGAIIESGAPLAFWAVHNDTVDHASFTRQVASKVGCQNEAMAAVIECLRRAPVEGFLKHHWQFPRISPSALNFKPRVDGEVLVESPRAALEAGRHHHVPVLMGVVEEEWARSMGWFYRELTGVDKNNSDGLDRETFERSIKHVITKRFWWPLSVADVVTHAYTDWRKVNEPILNRANYISFMSDLTMVAPSVKTANILSRQEVPVYLYRFNHRSIHTDPPWWGSYHSLELDYVFGSPFLGYDIAVDKWVNHTEDDKALSRRIMRMWTNFATYSSPTPNNTTGGTNWKRYTQDQGNYLYITASSSSNQEQLRPDKMALWNDLIPKLLNTGNVSCKMDIPLGGMVSPPDYQLLAWVFLASSLSFFTSFVVVVCRLLSLRKREAADATRYYNGQPPVMV